jgi:hypothetical protein
VDTYPLHPSLGADWSRLQDLLDATG